MKNRTMGLLTAWLLTQSAWAAQVDMDVAGNWGSGFQGEITIVNDTVTPINGWTLTFTKEFSITQIWNANITSDTGSNVVLNDVGWNGTIQPGAQITFGFIGGGTPTIPADFVVNGEGGGGEGGGGEGGGGEGGGGEGGGGEGGGGEGGGENNFNCTPGGQGDWLRVVGNIMVDRNCNPVWMTGANWFGFNASERVFHGLWSVNMEGVIKALAERGINTLRVPISTQLLNEWRNNQATTTGINNYANPELEGLTSLEIFDAFLDQAESYGMKVMLDVHSAEADNSGHVAPMWYKGAITTQIFYETWEWVADRYKSNDTLIAFDIQNEPHGTFSQTPRAKWDDSTDEDNWKYACETASNRILAINPKVLVMCEGIEVYPVDGQNWSSQDKNNYLSNWWGGNLRGVADHPIDLGVNQDQLVYSPHDYGPLVFLQPWFKGNFTAQTMYQDVWQPNWFYIHEQDISPLFIGEWGGFMDNGDNEKWMGLLRDFIVQHYLHHTFWTVNPNSGDTGGLLLNDWKTWDEDKYNTMLKPALWKDNNGKFVGLDHEVPLGGTGGTGITVQQYYQNNGAPPTGPEATQSSGSN